MVASQGRPQSVELSSQRRPGSSQAAQASANLISRGQGCLSREASKRVTVVTSETWEQPGPSTTSQAAQASANLISRGQCSLSRGSSKCVTVCTERLCWRPGRASKCKPNFPRPGFPLKGELKVCNCRHRTQVVQDRPRKQVQT